MSAANRCVLLIEDHPGLRTELRELLLDEGFAPVTVADARRARAWLAEGQPDLICSDLVLPEGSGYEICELVRSTERLKNVPVLVITGRSLPMDRVYAMEAGANRVLAKPFEADEFLNEIRALLGDGGAKTGTEAA